MGADTMVCMGGITTMFLVLALNMQNGVVHPNQILAVAVKIKYTCHSRDAGHKYNTIDELINLQK